MKEEKKKVLLDVNEFIRTRDALTSAYLSLSASIDGAVKAYIAHTEVVLKGDASLDVSGLLKPFNDIAAPQLAQLALAYQQNGGSAQTPAPGVEVNGKKKRAYKARDPNAPKRPLTAYFRFLQEARGPLAEQMAKTEGGSKPGDLTKMATERWKAMSTDDQAPYKEAYQRALKDYEAEVAKYKGTGADVTEEAAEDEEPQVEAAAEKVNESSTDTESSEEESEDEDAKLAMPPPPPPKAPSPVVAKTPKSSKKKKDKPEEPIPTPQFSSINPGVPVSSSKSASPELKRKAPVDSAEEGGKKKRGRKTKAEKEAIEAAAAKAAAEAVAPASDASADKPKKEKKKKRKSEA